MLHQHSDLQQQIDDLRTELHALMVLLGERRPDDSDHAADCASGIAAAILQRNYDEGKTISIPSLGITIKKADDPAAELDAHWPSLEPVECGKDMFAQYPVYGGNNEDSDALHPANDDRDRGHNLDVAISDVVPASISVVDMPGVDGCWPPHGTPQRQPE